VLLDTGHVLGNVAEVAPEEGFAAIPIASFRDDLVERMLGVESSTEGALVLVALVDPVRAADLPRLPERRSSVTEWRRALSAVGDRVEPGAPERIIAALQEAGRLPAGAEPVPRAEPSPVDPGDAPVIAVPASATEWTPFEPVQGTIAARRSTRHFEPRAIGKAAQLLAPELLETYLVAVQVDGIPPGSYAFDPVGRRLVERAPGGFGPALHHLGLDQEIFEDAAAVLIHAVDLTRAVTRYGDRAYRLALLDAGHVGERLNLAALREGIGVSGCGGYYDDEMNRVLRIPESRAVVYITVLGSPAE
jgi:SagB-type dehydrogenase family enzyme